MSNGVVEKATATAPHNVKKTRKSRSKKVAAETEEVSMNQNIHPPVSGQEHAPYPTPPPIRYSQNFYPQQQQAPQAMPPMNNHLTNANNPGKDNLLSLMSNFANNSGKADVDHVQNGVSYNHQHHQQQSHNYNHSLFNQLNGLNCATPPPPMHQQQSQEMRMPHKKAVRDYHAKQMAQQQPGYNFDLFNNHNSVMNGGHHPQQNYYNQAHHYNGDGGKDASAAGNLLNDALALAASCHANGFTNFNALPNCRYDSSNGVGGRRGGSVSGVGTAGSYLHPSMATATTGNNI